MFGRLQGCQQLLHALAPLKIVVCALQQSRTELIALGSPATAKSSSLKETSQIGRWPHSIQAVVHTSGRPIGRHALKAIVHFLQAVVVLLSWCFHGFKDQPMPSALKQAVTCTDSCLAR